MTEPAAIQAPRDGAAEFLEAASMLLESASYLDAVHLLHMQAALAAALDTGTLPMRYASLGEARRFQEQLWHKISDNTVSPARGTSVLAWLRGQPTWVLRVGALALGGALVLRYAWAVSRSDSWPRQHPEGNWISRFYTNATFEGFPLVRYDVGVNSDFGAGAPAKSMTKDNFSARWDTCLVVEREVVVPVSLTSDDQSKLLLDDVPKVEVVPGPGRVSMPLRLTPTSRHLVVELVEREGMAMIRLDGLEVEGSEDYHFERPSFDGQDVRCK